MSAGAGLPSKRWSLRGYDEEGNEVWLIRSFGQKLYRCPGCHGDIDVGAEHTVVQYVRRLARELHEFRHASLHPIRHLVLCDARGRLGMSKLARLLFVPFALHDHDAYAARASGRSSPVA